MRRLYISLIVLLAVCLQANELYAGPNENSEDTLYASAMLLYKQGDFADARSTLLKAAQLGHVESQHRLAVMCSSGEGGPLDYPAAVQWFKAAAHNGHSQAQFDLGEMYETGKGGRADKEKARQYYRMAAEQGHPEAQFNLGAIYFFGKGVPKDQPTAFAWFLKAAEQGEVRAQLNVAMAYDNGFGIGVDKKEAILWYKKAAEQGDINAQYNLGYSYTNGEGTTVDKPEALKWFKLAAQQNDPEAQNQVGAIYATGNGVDINEEEALGWFRKAAIQGHALATRNFLYLSAGSPADSKGVVVVCGHFQTRVPAGWSGYGRSELANLEREYINQSRQIYEYYNQDAIDETKHVDLAAFRLPEMAGSFVLVEMAVPPQSDVIGLLKSQVQDKMEWGKQQGHIRKYLGLVPLDHPKFSGFYTKVIGRAGDLQLSGGIHHKSIQNSILQLTLICPGSWDESRAANEFLEIVSSIELSEG